MAFPRGVKSFVLFVMFLSLVGCAHRRAIKAGDEFFERGAYREALESYRVAQEKRPASEEIILRVEDAEEELLGELLEGLYEAEGAEEIEESVVEAGRGLAWIEDAARVERLGEAAEDLVKQEGRRRLGEEDFEAALRLLDQYVGFFGEGSEEIESLDVLVRHGWLRRLEEAAQEHEEAGRNGARALVLAQADYLAFDDRYKTLAQQAVDSLLGSEGWSVHISANLEDRALEAAVDQVFLASWPQGIVDGRQGRDFGVDVQVRLVRAEPIFEEWDELETRSGEYQSGTELVENPAYRSAEDSLYQAEQRLSEAERELTRAHRDSRNAERDLREQRRRGQSTSYQESNLDRAYREIDRRESEVDSRQRDVERAQWELREIDQYLERPVYSEHYYEVTLQNARLRSSYRLDLIAPSRSFSRTLTSEAVETGQSERYLPQPVLDLDGRQDPRPTRRELEQALEDSTVSVLIQFIEEGFQQYRYERFGTPVGLEKEEEIDRLATFIVLDPEQRDLGLEEQLNEVSGLEHGAALLIRGDW